MRYLPFLFVILSGLAGLPNVKGQQPSDVVFKLVTKVEWSPDGSKIVLKTSGEGVWIFSQDHLYPLFQEPFAVADTTWSPDSSYLAVLYIGGTVEIWDVTSLNTPEVMITFSDEGVRAETFEKLAWHPDGNLLAITGSGVRFWNPMNGTFIRKILEDQRISPILFEWSPNGATLLAASSPSMTKLYFWDLASGMLQELNFPTTITDVTWGIDSETVAVVQSGSSASSHEIQFFHLSMLNEPITTLLTSDYTIVVQWNGNSVASTVGLDIQVWDLSTQQLVTQFTDAGTAFALSPDGLQIAYIKDGNFEVEDLPVPPSEPALRTRLAGCILPADQGILNSLNIQIDTGQWQAFINEVETEHGKKISEDCAADLIEMAQYLRDNP